MLTSSSRTLSFTLQGSDDSPVVNPCFVIRHWDGDETARVSVDGKALPPGPGLRQGIVRDGDGRRSLVLWMERDSRSAVHMTIGGD